MRWENSRRRCANANRTVVGISAQAQACLMGYEWPGNVRELENAIERAVVLGATETVLLEDLPETLAETERPVGESCTTSIRPSLPPACWRAWSTISLPPV